MPVDRGVATAFRQLRFDDPLEHRAVDRIERPTAKVLIEPTKLRLIACVRGLVLLLLQPPYGCLVPTSARPVAQLLLPPGLRIQLIVELLRLGFVGSPSSSAYSLPVWCNEVDPPLTASLAK